VVHRTKHLHHSTTPPRCSEYNSGHGVLVSQGQNRLEIEPSYISEDRSNLWPTGDRFVRHKANSPVPTLLQLVARSLCTVNRCIYSNLDRSERLCQPSLEPHRQSPFNSSEILDLNSSCSSSVEWTTMVPSSAQNVNKLSQTNACRDRTDIQLEPNSNHASTSSGRDKETNSFQRMLQCSYLVCGGPR